MSNSTTLRTAYRPLVTALVLGLALAACGGDDDSESADPVATEDSTDDPSTDDTDETDEQGEEEAEESLGDPEPVTIGLQVSLWGSPLVVAEEQGFWQEAGVEAESVGFSAGAEVRDALIAGSVDCGSVGVTPFIVGAASGEMSSVAVAGYVGNTLALVVNPELGLESVADIEGLSLASQAGSSTELVFLQRVLPEFGLDESDINLANVPFNNHPAALATGQVDGFLGVEPFPAISVTQGGGEILETFGAYDLVPNFFVCRTQFVEENPEAATRVTHAFLLAMEWMNANPDDAADVVFAALTATGAEVDEESTRNSLAAMDLNPQFVDELEDYLTEQAELLEEQGNIDSAPNWDEALRRDILDAAGQR